MMNLIIKEVNNEQELEKLIEFDQSILKAFEISINHRTFWLNQIKEHSKLLIYGEIDKEIVGLCFGKLENKQVTISILEVKEEFRGLGIGKKLLHTLEKNGLELGYHHFVLGGRREAEGFYLKQGYDPSLFIQSKHPRTLLELRSLNKDYEETWSFDDGEDIRLCLLTKRIDRDLENIYLATFNECHTMTLFKKDINN